MTTFELHKGKVVNFLCLVYFLCLLPIAIYCFKRPYHNWDMLAYMGVVVKMDHSDINQIHQLVYQQAKADVPAEEFVQLIDPHTAYRNNMSQNSVDFYQQLPFYTVKPLYTGFIFLLHKIGFPLASATVLPSIIGYLLIGLLLFLWLSKYLTPMITWVGALLLMYSTPMINLARLSTPDCLSGFLLLAAMYYILEKPSAVGMFLFLVLSVFCRIDNFVTGFIIISFLAMTKFEDKKISLSKYILMLGVLVTSYLAVAVKATEGFSWSFWYFPKFAHFYNLSYNLQTSFSLNKYFALAYSHGITALVSTNMVFFLFIVLLIVVFPIPTRFRKFNFDQLFCLLLTLIILIRYILYPNIDDRFYIAFYLVFIMVLVKKLSQNHKPELVP
jgi:hypothetical protein